MKRLSWMIGVAAATALVSGCASSSGDTDADRAANGTTEAAHEHSAEHSAEHSDEHSGGESLVDSGSDGSSPSQAARMICTDATADSVAKTYALAETPHRVDSWKSLTYTCTYHLPDGALVLSVKDSPDLASGSAYYDRLHAETPDARAITGLDSLGLPSFETQQGQVAFLKEGKTLLVDASDLGGSGDSASAGAYQVATTVVACWTKH